MNLFIFIMFLPVLAAICAGIWHKEKLVRMERGVVAGVKQTVKDWRAEHLTRQRVLRRAATLPAGGEGKKTACWDDSTRRCDA